jgi:hypothetical protein
MLSLLPASVTLCIHRKLVFPSRMCVLSGYATHINQCRAYPLSSPVSI